MVVYRSLNVRNLEKSQARTLRGAGGRSIRVASVDALVTHAVVSGLVVPARELDRRNLAH